MRVLLVEDDPATSKSIEMMLTHANLNVYATDLGEEGVDLAKLYDYDLILLDLGLPDMNGHEVLRQLRLARIEELSEADEAPKGAVTLPVEGGSFCLPLADVIDVAAEKARLEKAIAKLAKEEGGLKGKLSNEKFVANAPEAVVAENRARLEVIGEEMATLKAAFERVAALG